MGKRLTVLFLIGILLCFFLVGCYVSDEQGKDLLFSANGSVTADGDGDPIAKWLTLSADGMAEYLI